MDEQADTWVRFFVSRLRQLFRWIRSHHDVGDMIEISMISLSDEREDCWDALSGGDSDAHPQSNAKEEMNPRALLIVAS